MDNILNITMDQGSSLDYSFYLQTEDGDPFNLSGYDVRMQVRKSYGSTSTEINATLANGKVALENAAGGHLKVVLLPSDTSSIRFNGVNDESLECVYDLEIISPVGQVWKPARGTFTLNREVTR